MASRTTAKYAQIFGMFFVLSQTNCDDFALNTSATAPSAAVAAAADLSEALIACVATRIAPTPSAALAT